jgi:hypothetical protein
LSAIFSSILVASLAAGLAGCDGSSQNGQPKASEIVPAANSTTQAASTIPPAGAETENVPASPTPSSTPQALAATVNSEGISLAEYQAELERYKAASGTDLAPEEKQRVLQDLIDQVLLSQGAAGEGFMVDESLLEERMAALAEQAGGAQALADWMQANSYDEKSFRQALRRSIAAAWMRDRIIALMPKTAEQVHARQILLYDSAEAEDVLSQLKAGNDFGNLALTYDSITGGDLGWFPRGYLPNAGLEEAIFALQIDEFSPVIETLAGFHIVQLLERDPQRPLSPDALLIYQWRAVQEWLEQRRSASQIEILSD